MPLFRGDLRADLQLEVEARQLRLMSKGFGLVGMMLFGAGGLAWLSLGTLGLLFGIMGIFFGLMLLVAAGALRFAARQKEFELAALEAQMDEERGVSMVANEASPPQGQRP